MLIGVADLEQAGERVLAGTGLASVPGGRHHGWGTANRIVPLEESYLELLAVVDRAEAAADPIGQGFIRLLRDGDRPLLWVVATADLDATAARLGLPVSAKSRNLPDGTRVGWRSAGLEVALERPGLPFFIEWQVPAALHPGRMGAPHQRDPYGIAWVEIGADRPELEEWLAGAELPIRLGGAPGVNAVGVATGTGEIVVRAPAAG